MCFDDYTITKYKSDIDMFGLEAVWDSILDYNKHHNTDGSDISVEKFGELYEIGLAHQNKHSKKESGIYYTPKDIADLLADFFADLKADCIADVCCGTGNLILAYFEFIGKKQALKLLENGKVYLYDSDKIAMKICANAIGIKYGEKYINHIHCIVEDFLNKNIHLPSNCKVISNPPYYKINEIPETWNHTEVVEGTRELYSAFMEKIIKESGSSVIITPYSFIGGDKYYPLRSVMNQYNGNIICFDNVPAAIFKGKKHGVFNSNSSNGVRAAITITENAKKKHGYRVSPLLRFKTEERKKLIDKQMLLDFVGEDYQIVSKSNKRYYKCFNSLLHAFKAYNSLSSMIFEDLISEEPTKYKLNISASGRYYLSCAKSDLNRTGKHILYFKNRQCYDFAYGFINSSFAYWYWRMYDGGFTFPIGLLKSAPIFYQSLSEEDFKLLHRIVVNMEKHEKEYFVYKKNAGKIQENIKFPVKYRDELNHLYLTILHIDGNERIFDVVHSNRIFEEDI